MATTKNLAENYKDSDPIDDHDAAESAVPQELEVESEEHEFHSETQPASNPPSESEGIIRIPLDQIFIDGSISPRASLDIYTVQQYAAALIRGEKFLPITVEETKDHDYRILKGVLRFEAYRLRRDIYTGKLVADFYDDPLPRISDEELNTIPCFIETVPPEVHPMIIAMEDNRKHGKPLTSEDYRKIARQIYKDNLGASISGLAKLIKISRKVFTKYVRDLVDAFEKEKEAFILELHDQGVPGTKIAQKLEQKFPQTKGCSDSTVNDLLRKKKISTEEFNADRDHTSPGGDDPGNDAQGEEDDGKNGSAAEEATTPRGPSPKPVELKIICGNNSDTIMILGLTSLAPHFQEKLKTEVEALVNQIREENLAAQDNNEDPEQVDPEPHHEAPEAPEIGVQSIQASKEKPTVQNFRSAIQPSRGSRPRTYSI